MKIFKQIHKEIKAANTIVIARHIGPDCDCVGAAHALRDSLKLMYPNKNIYAVGSPAAKLSYLGPVDRIKEQDIINDLLIVLDTPNIARIDGVNPDDYKQVIKIDHHPFMEVFSDIEWIDEDAASTSEMIYELLAFCKMPINEQIAGYLYIGIAADTDRFLYIGSRTLEIAAALVRDYKLDLRSLYQSLKERNQNEWRFFGYVIQNMKVTKYGLGYIFVSDEELKKYNVDSALMGNMINDFSFIKGIKIRAFFTENKQVKKIKVNIRSDEVVVNKLCEQYGGGGHELASGIRLDDEADVKKIIKELDKLLKDSSEEAWVFLFY